MTISRKNNAGFTLTEVVVAILIIMVGMLGLLQAVGVATEHNLKNQLRDEAVQVGEKYMNIQRAKPFDLLSTPALGGYHTRYEPSRVRGRNNPYSVDLTVDELSESTFAPSRQLNVTVSWTYKGVTYQNRVSAPVSILR